MKAIIILCVIIAASTYTTHAASDTEKKSDSKSPVAKTAVLYLKRLASDQLDLAKDTALSKHCGIQRRKDIRTQLDSLKKNFFRAGDTFSIEAQKLDNQLAGVLIRAENPAAPLSTRIHAVALIKKDEQWKAAPLPGLFSNSGYGYDEKVEQAVRSLELWLAREKTLREDQLRKKATNAFKSRLATIEEKAGLDTMEPQEAVGHFIEQCRNKDLMAILACMGGASDALANPMEATIDVISDGLAETDTSSDWHLLTSRSVIAQLLKIDNTRDEVAMGFYNPLDRGKSKVLYFPVHRAEGKIFVRLSPMLKIALLPQKERWQQRWKNRRGDEDELRKNLPAAIFKNTPAINQPTAKKLLDSFLSALKKNDFQQCLSLTPRTGSYFSKADNQAATLTELGSMWRSIDRIKTAPSQTFDILEEKNVALAPLQYARTNRSGEFQTFRIWMIKDADGWHLIGPDTLNQNIGDAYKKSAEKLEKRFLLLEKERQNKHARSLLDQVVTLTPPLTLDPVDKAEAKKLFTEFRGHLRTKDTKAALSSCAVFKGTNSSQTLKIFNYAIRGAADHTEYDHICGITQAGKWIGLSVRTESKLVGVHDYPLYLIARTEQGPRIMLDIDLRQASNKGKEILNKKYWRKLEEILPKESLENVKTIFKKHLELTTKDVEEVLKMRE